MADRVPLFEHVKNVAAGERVHISGFPQEILEFIRGNPAHAISSWVHLGASRNLEHFFAYNRATGVARFITRPVARVLLRIRDFKGEHSIWCDRAEKLETFQLSLEANG